MKKIILTLIYSLAFTYAIASDLNVTPSNKIATANQTDSVVALINCNSDSPCFIVKDTSTKVINAINSDSSIKQSSALIKNIVTPQFDFNLMTRYALGNNWKKATPAQQEQLIDSFKQLLIFTYSSALSKFKDAKITIINESINDKKAAVISQVVLPNSDTNTQPIKVEYDLAKTVDSQSWKAYDIKIENASLVTTYRNQFNEIIQTSQIDGLIKQLKNKVTALQKRK